MSGQGADQKESNEDEANTLTTEFASAISASPFTARLLAATNDEANTLTTEFASAARWNLKNLRMYVEYQGFYIGISIYMRAIDDK
jgi:hypothetical protein